MRYFSQKDPHWSDMKLGNSIYTLGKYGCYLTCLAMIVDKTPLELNHILTMAGCISKEGLLDSFKAATVLGKKYARKTQNTKFPCIGETDHFKKMGYPQHFIVLLDRATRIDPLDLGPQHEPNNYNIVSYRLFT